MKEQNRIAYVVNSKFYPLLLFFVSFVFVTLFSRSTSFLYVFEGADPAIFKQMGLAVLKGKTLYVDYFDNKGCILYFIHAFGLWLGGNFGILALQILSLTLTLIIWDKILGLYRDERGRIVGLSIGLFLLFCYYGAGDQTQEWCLPFVSYPLLVYCRSIKDKSKIRMAQMFIIGICLGIITFIQINNTCLIIGFVAYSWIQYLSEKDFRNLLKSVASCIAGWMIIAIVCVLYFYLKSGGHGVYEMYYAMFLSNIEYVGIQQGRPWQYWLPYTVLVLLVIAIQILNYQHSKPFLIPVLISIALFVLTFGRRCNSFYLAAILPLFIINLATIDTADHKVANRWLFSLTAAFSVFVGIMSFFHVINDLILRKEKEVVIYNSFHQCIQNIPEKDRDSIFNYNLFWHGYSMMQHENLLQCNRVSVAFDLPTLMKEEASKPPVSPKWIMMSPNMKYYDNDASFILDNYELVDSLHYDRLYFNRPRIGNDLEILFFRRKD